MVAQKLDSDIESLSSDGSFTDLPFPSVEKQHDVNATQPLEGGIPKRIIVNKGVEAESTDAARIMSPSKPFDKGTAHITESNAGVGSTLSPSSSVSDGESNIDFGDDGTKEDHSGGQYAHLPAKTMVGSPRQRKEVKVLPEPIFVLLPSKGTLETAMRVANALKVPQEKGSNATIPSQLDTNEGICQQRKAKNDKDDGKGVEA